MKCPQCGSIFKDPARSKGGKKSRRVLTTKQAKAMVKLREEKRRDKNEGS
jgi:hypothetical protein